MLKANTLLTVVIISLIIGVLCSNLILYSYYSRLQSQKDLALRKLLVNHSSARAVLLSDSSSYNLAEGSYIDLYGEGKDSVFIRKSPWGIFELGLIRSFSGTESIGEIVLSGYPLRGAMASAVYVKDSGKPLVLAGNCKIKGDCFISSSGVMKSDFGRYIQANYLVEGAIKKSESRLPSVDSKMVENLYTVFLTKEFGENVEPGLLDTIHSLERSFYKKSLLFKSDEVVYLTNKHYAGNIIVSSANRVIIDSTSKLSDILVFAPVVEVKSGFNGRLQLFATDSLIIKEHCNFNYPTVAGIVKPTASEHQSVLLLEDSINFKGIIFSQGKEKDSGFMQTMITIEKGTTVLGQVFTDGLLNLKGAIYGNATCNSFYAKTPAEYENHIFDATIDYSKLPEIFIGSGLVFSGHKKEIVLCLEKE